MKVRTINLNPAMALRGFTLGTTYEANVLPEDEFGMVWYEIANPDPNFKGVLFGNPTEAPLGFGHWLPSHFSTVENDND